MAGLVPAMTLFMYSPCFPGRRARAPRPHGDRFMHAYCRVARRAAALIAAIVALLPATAPAQSIDEKAQLCAGCHGENGIPQQKIWPVIWGAQQGYLYVQLRDFKSGARKDDIMGPIAQSL